MKTSKTKTLARLAGAGLLAALSATAAHAADATACNGAADLPQLQRYADALDAAWNARDAETLAQHYRSDATLGLERSGVRVAGRAEILRYFSQSLQAVPAGVLHRTQVRRATPLGEDLCLTDSAVALERAAAGADGRMETLGSFSTLTVLQRGAQGWEIVAVRAIALGRPAPAGEARGG